jgi:hypothetical protein
MRWAAAKQTGMESAKRKAKRPKLRSAFRPRRHQRERKVPLAPKPSSAMEMTM